MPTHYERLEKSCPFCGGPGVLVEHGALFCKSTWIPKCCVCRTVLDAYPTKDKARWAWNYRPISNLDIDKAAAAIDKEAWDFGAYCETLDMPPQRYPHRNYLRDKARQALMAIGLKPVQPGDNNPVD